MIAVIQVDVNMYVAIVVDLDLWNVLVTRDMISVQMGFPVSVCFFLCHCVFHAFPIDLNECLKNPCNTPTELCFNTPGSYICQPHPSTKEHSHGSPAQLVAVLKEFKKEDKKPTPSYFSSGLSKHILFPHKNERGAQSNVNKNPCPSGFTRTMNGSCIGKDGDCRLNVLFPLLSLVKINFPNSSNYQI